jgi:hypothetical protein
MAATRMKLTLEFAVERSFIVCAIQDDSGSTLNPD